MPWRNHPSGFPPRVPLDDQVRVTGTRWLRLRTHFNDTHRAWMIPGTQKSSPKMTWLAAVSVMPTPQAVSDSTATIVVKVA